MPTPLPATPHGEPPSPARRWLVLATVSLGLLLITLDNSILYTALPRLTHDLGATGIESLWIINAYPLVMVGLLLGTGTLGDRIGHRRMYLIGLVIFGAASLLAAFSATAWILVAARAVLAAGAASMMPATLALIRTTFVVERERNLAIAVWGSISVVGFSLGPILGGTLLEFFWWGSVFLINVPAVVVAIVLAMLVAPRDRPDATKRWDLMSSVYAMIGLVGAVVTIKEVAHANPSWLIAVIGALAGAIGFIAFVRRQRHMAEPTLELTIFRNRAFSSGVIAACVALFAVAGLQLVTTQRFQMVVGFTPLEAGLLVAAIALGTLPTSLLGGAMLHRVGLRVLIAGGFALATVGAVFAVFSIDHLVALVIALIVVGLGLGGVFSVASTAIIGNAPVSKAGMAAAVEEVSYEFGGLLAVALLGSMTTFLYSATVQLPEGANPDARDSLSDALATAPGDAAILGPAFAAYDTAFLWVLATVAGVLGLAAVITGVLLREYGPGSRSQEHSEH